MEPKTNLPTSPSDTAITRTPAHVAADINKVKLNLAVAVVVSSIEIGRLLLEAKALVPHGEWGEWLAANVDFSESKAQSLMRRYKEYGDGQIDMITGTSDLDFFSFLSDSQMDALLALPKPERREFVEEHREELESGEMSVRDLKKEIAKLVKENDKKAEDLARADDRIAELEESLDGLGELLDKERNKPAPEPVVQEVITHQPSPEQIDKIRAEEAAKADKRIEDLQKAQQIRIDAIQGDKKRAEEALDKAKKAREKAEAERDAKDAALKKAHTDHEDELAALTEKHEAELAAAREEGNAGEETAAEAAARIAELEKSLKMANPAVSEFRGLFEAANSLIAALKSKLETVRCIDPEAAAKLDKAMAALAAMITRKEATT